MSKALTVLCTVAGVATEQITDVPEQPTIQVGVMVTGSVISYLIIEFLKGFKEGWKEAREKRNKIALEEREE